MRSVSASVFKLWNYEVDFSDDFLKIKGIVFELFEMAAQEELFYSMNPHMREFKNVKFYSFPEDENRMCPIERVNIPVLGSC